MGTHLDDQRDSDLGAVGALRENARPALVDSAVGDPHTLGVEVEGRRE
jgi:hypothetical protein